MEKSAGRLTYSDADAKRRYLSLYVRYQRARKNMLLLPVELAALVYAPVINGLDDVTGALRLLYA